MNLDSRIPVGLAALLAAITTTVFAATPFTLEKRIPAQSAERYGDIPLGALIRTDERYSRDRLIQGPRGWHY